jgi:hypothetical protein
MSKPAPKAPPEKVAQYEKVLAKLGLERKGAALPYTSMNGNMYSLLTPSGELALRLPEDEREAFIKKHKTRLCEQYGVVMKEYVVVPDAVFSDGRALAGIFSRSHAYAATLKPKATTRKKPGAKAAKKPGSAKRKTKR